MSDHYTTLGVPRTASPDDIKRAYRKLASQHHPDKGGNVQTFQQIEEAYRILSDPQSRAQYDNPQPQFHQGGMPPGFEDIFSNFFGGNHPFGDMFGRRNTPQRNRNLNINTSITLEDAFYGKDLLANLRLPSGKEQVLEIKIPPGIRENTTMRLSGIGDDSIANAPRGDIFLTVQIMPHSNFRRDNDDLIQTISITCIDAMIGKTIEVNTIEGKTLAIDIEPGTQTGQILAIQGHGMPNMRDIRFRGRMLIELDIIIPKNLNQDQLDGLKKLFP